MTADLPDRWDDEPWPLDDPVPAPGLNPVNWSDTHDEPPQVADLADEAWEYALDRGISMERALVELQDRAINDFEPPAFVWSWSDPNSDPLGDLRRAVAARSPAGGHVTMHFHPGGNLPGPNVNAYIDEDGTPRAAATGIDLTPFIAQPDDDP